MVVDIMYRLNKNNKKEREMGNNSNNNPRQGQGTPGQGHGQGQQQRPTTPNQQKPNNPGHGQTGGRDDRNRE
jgi:hypothetical protein